MTFRSTIVRRRAPISTAATLVGAVFLVIGILGFVPGITTHYGQMAFAGHTSHARLLGEFEVSVLHNIVHLLFGVVGLAAGRAGAFASQGFLVIGGIMYLALWVYGVAVAHGSQLNFVPVDDADNWLHLVLAVSMIVLGLTLSRRRRFRLPLT